MVVVGALGTVMAQLTLRAAQDYTEAAQGAALHARANLVMERIDRELREIRINPAGTTAAPDISAVTNSSIAWNKAAGGCLLSLSGTQLLLADGGGAAAVLADDVSSFSVMAIGDNGTALTLPLNAVGGAGVRRIQVSLTLAKAGQTATLRTRVFVRCTLTGAAP